MAIRYNEKTGEIVFEKVEDLMRYKKINIKSENREKQTEVEHKEVHKEVRQIPDTKIVKKRKRNHDTKDFGYKKKQNKKWSKYEKKKLMDYVKNYVHKSMPLIEIKTFAKNFDRSTGSVVSCAYNIKAKLETIYKKDNATIPDKQVHYMKRKNAVTPITEQQKLYRVSNNINDVEFPHFAQFTMDENRIFKNLLCDLRDGKISVITILDMVEYTSITLDGWRKVIVYFAKNAEKIKDSLNCKKYFKLNMNLLEIKY